MASTASGPAGPLGTRIFLLSGAACGFVGSVIGVGLGLIGTGTRFSWRETNAWYTETLPSNGSAVNTFAPAGNMQWWVGTAGSGLYHYNDLGVTPVFTRYTTAEGLPSNTITALMRDSQSRLWVGTPSGLSLRADAGTTTVVLGPNGSYLTGFCRLRQDDRVFRMDRIRCAEPVPGPAGLARPVREPEVPDLFIRAPVWE